MAPCPRTALVCISMVFLVGCDGGESPVAPPQSPGLAATSAQGQVAFTSNRDGNNEIYVMNPDGSGVTRLTDNPAIDQDPAWSPDGGRIAFTSTRNGNYDIYVMNADGTGVTQLTTTTTNRGSTRPAWCGNRIAFESDRYIAAFPDVYVMNDDGTDVTRLTLSNGAFDQQPAWSPTCDRIAFTKDPGGNVEIYVMNADGTGATRLTNSVGYDQDPAWSPDGAKIAFTSTRADDPNREIYVMNADGTGVTRLTNTSTSIWDSDPAWSSDGSQIAFRSNRDGNNEIYVMNADGSGVTRLTNDASSDALPAWAGAFVLPASSDEPVFNAAAGDAMIFQDHMEEYTTPHDMDTWPGASFHPFFPDDPRNHYAVINPGHASSQGLQLVYLRGGVPGDEERLLWETNPEDSIWYAPDDAAFVVQYWFRISKNGGPGGSPGYGGTDKGMKWIEFWQDGHLDRSQFGVTAGDATTGPLWHLNAAGTGVPMGYQPVGPYWNQVNDNQWHRVTYLYQPSSSPGETDGVARMWIDGTKIVDVSAAAAGITPPGGTTVWCTIEEVGKVDTHPTRTIHLGEYVNGFDGDGVTDLPMALAFDDFTWWRLPARVQ